MNGWVIGFPTHQVGSHLGAFVLTPSAWKVSPPIHASASLLPSFQCLLKGHFLCSLAHLFMKHYSSRFPVRPVLPSLVFLHLILLRILFNYPGNCLPPQTDGSQRIGISSFGFGQEQCLAFSTDLNKNC